MLINLESGLRQLNINASDTQLAQFNQFLDLLAKWNNVYNLTAIKRREEMIPMHLLDSLTLLPHVQNSATLLDIGTGAGLPGIPLAIMLPATKFILLDSNGKKTRFVQQCKAELILKNVDVINSRVETYQAPYALDGILTRAFASISETLGRIQHLITPQTKLFLMKSTGVENELVQINSAYTQETVDLILPGVDATRKLVILSRSKTEGENFCA